MSREERIENIRFQGGMSVMLNVLERLEKAEEQIYDLCSEVNALSLEVSLLRRDKAIGCDEASNLKHEKDFVERWNPNGIQT